MTGIYVLAAVASAATLGLAYRDRSEWSRWKWIDTAGCLLLSFPFWTGLLVVLRSVWGVIAGNL